MAAPIEVRRDLSSDKLRGFVRTSKDAGQVRRLLALAAILDGGSRSEAARIAGVALQIVRDWVLRFNEAGIAGFWRHARPQGPEPYLMTIIIVRWQRLSRQGRSLLFTVWCAGGLWIWCNGYGTSSKCRSAYKHSAMNCAPWAIASSPRVRVTTGRNRKTSPFLRRVRRPSGANPQVPPPKNANRAVVAGRSPERPAEQAHPALGQARHAPFGSSRSAAFLGMDLWRDLSC